MKQESTLAKMMELVRQAEEYKDQCRWLRLYAASSLTSHLYDEAVPIQMYVFQRPVSIKLRRGMIELEVKKNKEELSLILKAAGIDTDELDKEVRNEK